METVLVDMSEKQNNNQISKEKYYFQSALLNKQLFCCCCCFSKILDEFFKAFYERVFFILYHFEFVYLSDYY